jgi:tetratricopeptide (TPR) repeat protein
MADNIQVLSAVKKDKVISNAEIILQKNGKTSQLTHTKNNGKSTFQGFNDTRESTLIIKKTGYSTLVAQCPCDGLTYALSPNMKNLDGMRAVLTWGANPLDLDSHLAYENNHIYFSEKIGSKAHLDVDDTNSYGPETITIVKKKQGKKYLYAIHNYSKDRSPASKGLALSGATVRVYIGQTLVRTYKATPQKVGNIWIVFGIDENGAFQDINSYVGTTKSSDGVQEMMKDILLSGDFNSQSIISSSQKVQAKLLNGKGEKAYHHKNLEEAMYLFQDAINLYPNYGQAYSNLGLTFQKLHRDAEALWANRKAIERASGERANTIKASSYYNIAKVYESQGKWNEALSNYENALSNKSHSAYSKGIKRMKKKLN